METLSGVILAGMSFIYPMHYITERVTLLASVSCQYYACVTIAVLSVTFTCSIFEQAVKQCYATIGIIWSLLFSGLP